MALTRTTRKRPLTPETETGASSDTSNEAKRRKNKHSRIVGMRADMRPTFVNPDGSIEELNTVAVVDFSRVQMLNCSPNRAKANFETAAAAIPGHVPGDVTERDPKTNSPLKVVTRTPRKRVMPVVSSVGSVAYASNDPKQLELKVLRKHITDCTSFFRELSQREIHPFYETTQFLAIKKIQSTIKSQSIRLSEEHIAQAEELTENTYRSQNAVMVQKGVDKKYGSANDYARATNLLHETIPNLRFEWLHLIAYCVLGNQHEDNLVGGTVHANTEMLFTELEYKLLADHYPNGYSVEVTAQLLEGTHIALTIEMKIITDDFVIPFRFNALNPNRPHINFKKYIHDAIMAIVSAKRTPPAAGLTMSFDPNAETPSVPELPLSLTEEDDDLLPVTLIGGEPLFDSPSKQSAATPELPPKGFAFTPTQRSINPNSMFAKLARIRLQESPALAETIFPQP